jgi:glutaminyl-tRNA synthetase
VKYIGEEKIMNNHRYGMAIEYLLLKHEVEELDMEEFNKTIGVGVVVSEEDIKQAVETVMQENQQEIETLRYTVNLTKYLKMLREKLQFAEPGLITKVWTASLAAKLGP